MDYSVAVIPVTKADKSIDSFDTEYAPLNDVDKMNWGIVSPSLDFPSAATLFFLWLMSTVETIQKPTMARL